MDFSWHSSASIFMVFSWVSSFHGIFMEYSFIGDTMNFKNFHEKYMKGNHGKILGKS